MFPTTLPPQEAERAYQRALAFIDEARLDTAVNQIAAGLELIDNEPAVRVAFIDIAGHSHQVVIHLEDLCALTAAMNDADAQIRAEQATASPAPHNRQPSDPTDEWATDEDPPPVRAGTEFDQWLDAWDTDPEPSRGDRAPTKPGRGVDRAA